MNYETMKEIALEVIKDAEFRKSMKILGTDACYEFGDYRVCNYGLSMEEFLFDYTNKFISKIKNNDIKKESIL